jgi:hypothetical protein
LAKASFVLFAEKKARLILHVELKEESTIEETTKE